ncbi:MAG: hypothetical protein K2X38_20445 [Gemmataceae bacterium]|nr:hypothetical protein [Gemmataceae bacterium]
MARMPFWGFLVLLALAGCRTSQGTDKGCCGGTLAKGSAPTLLPAPNVAPASGSPASRETKVAYGGQKTCPVTGDALGSMGAPIPVSVAGGETIYVCCRGCENKVRQDPATYLRKVETERSVTAGSRMRTKEDS